MKFHRNPNFTVPVAVAIPYVNRVDEIELRLTPEEAVTLKIILSNIGGDPYNSLRGYAESIGNKMGIISGVSAPKQLMWDDASAIYFQKDTKQDASFRKIVDGLRAAPDTTPAG